MAVGDACEPDTPHVIRPVRVLPEHIPNVLLDIQPLSDFSVDVAKAGNHPPSLQKSFIAHLVRLVEVLTLLLAGLRRFVSPQPTVK